MRHHSHKTGKNSRDNIIWLTLGGPLGILGGGVPPSSSNPDPIEAQKMSFSTPVFRSLKSIPVFRPGLLAEIMSLLLRLERKQKNYSKPFRIRIFLFLSHIWPINAFIHSRSSL